MNKERNNTHSISHCVGHGANCGQKIARVAATKVTVTWVADTLHYKLQVTEDLPLIMLARNLHAVPFTINRIHATTPKNQMDKQPATNQGKQNLWW